MLLWLRFSIASFFLRVNDYLEAKIEHVLVDPEVNFVYTRRKRRRLGLEDALDPNSSAPSDYFLLMDGGQYLQKLPVRKWTEILRIQEKSTKTGTITRCLQDFEKPRLFWLMNTLTRSRLTKIKVIFIIAGSASTGSKNSKMQKFESYFDLNTRD